MGNRTQVRSEERRLTALDHLTIAADDLDRAVRQRILYIGYARQYGVTWRDIAAALRMTETGARLLYERNRDMIGGA